MDERKCQQQQKMNMGPAEKPRNLPDDEQPEHEDNDEEDRINEDDNEGDKVDEDEDEGEDKDKDEGEDKEYVERQPFRSAHQLLIILAL